MSASEVTGKAKEALQSVKGLLEKAEERARKEMTKAAPAVQKSLDKSFETAANGFRSTMKTIDTRTEREQLGLLRAYKSFLKGQSEYIDSRLKRLEDRAASTS